MLSISLPQSLSQDEIAAITAADPVGKKRSVDVRVDYLGGDKQAASSYRIGFSGSGTTEDGDLVCLGPPGNSLPSNRYVLTFQAIKGNYLRSASFIDPAPPHGFDFVAGVVDPADPCCITVDATEFEPPLPGPRESIVLVDIKKNSEHALGYRFTVWVTHYDGTVVPVPCDPRIINR